MGADLLVDSRLPALLEIDEPNRQQLRRAGRRQAKCWKCREECPPDDVCFADGKDAHRSCAEIWNAELLGALETLRTQDEEAPCAPRPSTMPDAPALTTP
jgi:hypothetical protein